MNTRIVPTTLLGLSKSKTCLVCASLLASLAPPAGFGATAVPASESPQAPLIRRGYSAMCMGLYKPAIAAFSGAVQANTNDLVARRYLCYALLHSGDTEGALKQLNFVMKAPVPDAVDYYLLGEVHLMMGLLDAADLDFRKAIVQRPDLMAATAGRIKIMVANCDYKHALALCQQAIQDVQRIKNASKRAAMTSYFQNLFSSIQLAQTMTPDSKSFLENPVTQDMLRGIMPTDKSASPRV